MKKLTALLLSVMMTLSVVPNAFAIVKEVPRGVLDSITVDDKEVNSIMPGSRVEVCVVFDVSDSDYDDRVSAYDFEITATVNNDDVEVYRVRNYTAGTNLVGARVTLDVDPSIDVSETERVGLTVKLTPDSTITKRYFRTSTFKDYLDINYEEFNMDDMYDAYDEMREYDDDYMYFSPNVSAVSKDAIRYLRGKLKNAQYCYFDFYDYGIGISGAAAKKLALKPINFAANTDVVSSIERVLDKGDFYGDVDYLTFVADDKLNTTVRVGVVPENGGEYVYRYVGNNLFIQYKTYESNNYDLEFDAYILDTYIITTEKLPKSMVYKSGTMVSASTTESGSSSSSSNSSTTTTKKLVLKKK